MKLYVPAAPPRVRVVRRVRVAKSYGDPGNTQGKDEQGRFTSAGGDTSATGKVVTPKSVVRDIASTASKDAKSMEEVRDYQATRMDNPTFMNLMKAAQEWQGLSEVNNHNLENGAIQVPGELGWQEHVDLVQAQVEAGGTLKEWTCPVDGHTATPEQLLQAANEAKSLSEAIAAAPKTEVPLYRGMTILDMDSEQAEEAFAVGETLEISLGSFSGIEGAAAYFANNAMGINLNDWLVQHPEVVDLDDAPPASAFVIEVEPGIHALPLRPLADVHDPDIPDLFDVDEYLAAGRFEVTSIQAVGANLRGDTAYRVTVRPV